MESDIRLTKLSNCAGCGAKIGAGTLAALLGDMPAAKDDNLLVGFGEDTNYLTFDHPNSDKAIADVRSRAERLCQQRKQVAIKTQSACSLTKCATNYQCVDDAAVIQYGL